MVGGKWHIGRKAIIAFLTPILDLSDDFDIAWRKVRRWKKGYCMPIELGPNRRPYIDEEVFESWWVTFCHKRNRKSEILTPH